MVLPLFVRLHSRHVFLCNFSCGATSAILIGQVQSTEDTSSVVTLIASWCVNETRRYEGSLSLRIERIAFAIVPVEVRYPDRIVGIALLL
jgi:hypothetical protein